MRGSNTPGMHALVLADPAGLVAQVLVDAESSMVGNLCEDQCPMLDQ
jgi:hypothetical protein